MADTIRVEIQSSEEVVWEGEAEALSSKNAEGPFDILPNHANFMTFVQGGGMTLHLKGGETREFSFDRAVLYFHEDVAKIYI